LADPGFEQADPEVRHLNDYWHLERLFRLFAGFE
jgi:hypothetical protein